MKDALKDILEAARSGHSVQRILVLFSTKAGREAFKLELANASDEADIPYFVQRATSLVRIGDATVHLRLAHDNIDRELRGLEWHSAHGLGCLEDFPNGLDIAISIQSRVRLK